MAKANRVRSTPRRIASKKPQITLTSAAEPAPADAVPARALSETIPDPVFEARRLMTKPSTILPSAIHVILSAPRQTAFPTAR
jgi:hypothetical protein